jgi:hypothetical protein
MKTNVPPIRYNYRIETLKNELSDLKYYADSLEKVTESFGATVLKKISTSNN